MNKSRKFPPEVRERAIRMVLEHRGEYPSLWTAVELIAPKIGCVPQTLLTWVKQHEIETGQREGVTTAEAKRIKELERENKELRRGNEIFCPGGARLPAQVLRDFVDRHRGALGVEPNCRALHFDARWTRMTPST